MARTEKEDALRGVRAAKTVRQAAHGSSGGHSQATLAARAARQAARNPLELDPLHHAQRRHMAYEYQEYPKWVHPDGKPSPRSLIVQSRGEEETAMAGDEVVREAEERKRLVAVAEVKGVKIDKRWGLDKIEAAIIGAGFDPSLNPFA